MCFDFVLPLLFASIWESAAGSEGKVAVIYTVHLSQLKDNNLHAGNTAWELGGFFFSTVLHILQVSTGKWSVWLLGLPITLFRELMLTSGDKMGEHGYKAANWAAYGACSSWWWSDLLGYCEQQQTFWFHSRKVGRSSGIHIKSTQTQHSGLLHSRIFSCWRSVTISDSPFAKLLRFQEEIWLPLAALLQKLLTVSSVSASCKDSLFTAFTFFSSWSSHMLSIQ